MMTPDQFFELEKDNPHDHIRWAARRWLEKEHPLSILTWEDLVSKFINELYPPLRTTNLRNEISNFQQRFDESFHEVWDRYKDLLRACPRHGFTELHQLDTFYNALNSADQDSLNSAAGGNLLERRTQDVLTIIENKSKVCNSQNKSVVSQVKSSDANSNSSSEIAKLTHAVNQQTSAVTTAMTAILKQFQATPPPASVKVVEKICVTCGVAHPYYQCLATGANTFPELRDNIQGYVAAAVVYYNQGNSVYRPLGMANQIRPPGFAQPNVQNNQNRFSQPQGYNRGNNFNPEQSYQAPTQQNQVVPLRSGSLPSNTIANPKGELKSITTQSSIVLDSPSIPIPPPFINLEEDECVEETLTDQDLAEYTIKVLPPLVQKSKPPSQRNFVVHQRDPLHLNIPYPSMMHKQKQQEKDEEKLVELANTPLNENCSAVILKKLPEKLGDPEKFLIPCGFSELKCKALADLGASINLMPISVWKRVTLILGRPFLRTAHALIDVHGEEMILRDGDERLTLNMRHDTSSYTNQPQKESINLINVFNDSSEVFLENFFSTNHQSGNLTFSSHLILTSPKVKDDIFDSNRGNVLPERLLDLDSTKDLYPPHHVNPLSDSTTSSSCPNNLLEEFVDELALITFPLGNDDLQFDIESNLKEIEYLLYHDPIKDIDSILKDSIDQSNLADLNNNLVDSMPEMFTDEHDLDYSSPPLYDEYDDDLFEVESNTVNVYDDPFDSKGKKIKEFKLLIDELDLPCDFLLPSKYDSFLSKDFSKVDALPLTNNEDKVFNLGILIQENLFEVITHVAPEKNEKKLAISHASLMLEDFDPLLYELPFFKEVPMSKILLLF
nr:hypothetical protein [Tanacetum cinerariifolium]